jgi:hypothetical protein
MPYTCESGYGKSKRFVVEHSNLLQRKKKMNKIAMIKQAYAYGAAVALQELGYDVNTAQNAGVKLAEDEEGMHPALRALIGTGAGLGAGALAGGALGAGGGALMQKFKPEGAGRLTEMMQAGRGMAEDPSLAQSLMGHAYLPQAAFKGTPGMAVGREAMLGAQPGAAAGGALGALGGGLYGGLSE